MTEAAEHNVVISRSLPLRYIVLSEEPDATSSGRDKREVTGSSEKR
jgi:hypothetical protein